MPSARYLIALVPPDPLREQVRLLKEEMRDRFGSGHALKSPAHITLQMPFRLEQAHEPPLISLLERLSARQRPFSVEIRGFGAFPPRVIFLRIIHHEPIAALEQSLRETLAMAEEGLQPETSRMPFHPHMTIATRDLDETAFALAWEAFKGRSFKAAFEAAGLFLLKHNGQSWDLYREFRFGPGS